MTRYLLGQATSAEQTALEDRYAAEPEFFEALVALEDELAARYARRELPAAEQAAYERYVLAHPRRRARSEFAPAFARQLQEWGNAFPNAPALSWRTRLAHWWRARQRTGTLPLGLATAALLLLAGSWWLWRTLRTPAPINVAQRTGELTVPAPGPSPLNSPPTAAPASPSPSASLPQAVPSAPPPVLAFTLVGRVVRDGERIQRLVIPPATKQIRLQVNLEGETYPHYHAHLRSSAGREVLAQTNLKPAANQPFVVVNLPSSQLPPKDYFLVLSGVSADNEAEELVTYFFRVTRK